MITAGDVDFGGARQKVSFITPAPGGGPMTVARLRRNVVVGAQMQSN